ETLRSILEREAPDVTKRLGFGNDKLDPDSFAVTAPAVVEIPLNAKAVAALQGRQLLVECEVITPESAVTVQQSVGNKAPSAAKFGPNVEVLMRPESKAAKEMAASCEKICAAFPSRFFYVDGSRGLAAGFHLVEGVFRDDQPLVNS